YRTLARGFMGDFGDTSTTRWNSRLTGLQPFEGDNMSVMTVAQELLTTAWDALDRKPGRSIIQPGLSVAWDDCCDGQLWVRINGVTPVYKGNSDCSVAFGVTYAVGIIRSVHSLSDRGKAPTQGQITTDGLDMIDDMCRI